MIELLKVISSKPLNHWFLQLGGYPRERSLCSCFLPWSHILMAFTVKDVWPSMEILRPCTLVLLTRSL